MEVKRDKHYYHGLDEGQKVGRFRSHSYEVGEEINHAEWAASMYQGFSAESEDDIDLYMAENNSFVEGYQMGYILGLGTVIVKPKMTKQALLLN